MRRARCSRDPCWGCEACPKASDRLVSQQGSCPDPGGADGRSGGIGAHRRPAPVHILATRCVATKKSLATILTAHGVPAGYPQPRVDVPSAGPWIDRERGEQRTVLGATWIAYPTWLNPGDNAWQLTAATFVGLMSLPGLAVLYGGLVAQVGRQHHVDDVLRLQPGAARLDAVGLQHGLRGAYRHFGVRHGSFWADLVGNFEDRRDIAEQSQAVCPGDGGSPFHFPTATLAYFQFVFAAITPLLFLGSSSAASSSRRGCSSCRCGSPWSIASTPRCSGAAASSPRRARSTTRVGTSSTSRPA